MSEKPKVSPDGTYLFEKEDIEDYDELSVTRAMRDASTTLKKKLKKAEEKGELSVDDIDFGSLDPDR